MKINNNKQEGISILVYIKKGDGISVQLADS